MTFVLLIFGFSEPCFAKGGGGGHGGGSGGGGSTPTNSTTPPILELNTGTTVLDTTQDWQAIWVGFNAGTTAILQVNGAFSLDPTNGDSIYAGFSGNGTIDVSSTGAITQTGTATFFAGGSNGSAGTVNLTGGTITTTGGFEAGFDGPGALTITSGGVLTSGDNASYDTGVGINGATGTVVISGTGSKWISNDQYYFALGGYGGSAAVTIEAGGLLSTRNALFNTGGLSGGDWGGYSTVTITGAGSAWKNADTLDIGNTAASSLESLVTVENAGILQVGADGSPGVLTITGGGELNVGGGGSSGSVVASAINVQGKLDYDFTDASLTLPTQISVMAGGTFEKDGSGTLVLTSALSTSAAGSSILINAGTLEAPTTFLNQAAITDKASLIVDQASSGTLSSVVTGSGTVTVAGTGQVTFSGTNTYTGATTVTGLLSISADANLGKAPTTAKIGQLAFNGGTLSTTSSFTLNANRGVQVDAPGGTLSVASGTVLTYAGVIGAAGGGTLTKSGTGTLILSGASPNFAGGIDVAQGLLSLNGSLGAASITVAGGTLNGGGTAGALTIGSAGTLSPGMTVGTLSATSASIEGGSTYLWQIDAANGTAGSATGWDLLNLSNVLTFGGNASSPASIEIETMASTSTDGVPASFDPDQAYTFEIASASSIVGITAGGYRISTGLVDRSIGGTWTLETIGQTLDLTYSPVSAVPELPFTAVATALVALGLAGRKRRRNAGA